MSSAYLEIGLSSPAMQIHRALASLQEELEAIDSYHQRADVAEDPSLQAVLIHNRDDEMEHAMMLLEWLGRARPRSVGQDLTIGYKLHNAKDVELYFAEAFAFRVLEPGAAVERKQM